MISLLFLSQVKLRYASMYLQIGVKGIVQHFRKLAYCHDPSSHSSRFFTFNCRSKLLLDRRSRVPCSAATLRRLMEFLGFPHQTQQIHNQKTPKCCGGQVVTCTFTTLWDNNGTLRDVKQILGTTFFSKPLVGVTQCLSLMRETKKFH